ncbi:phage holin family protein [Streptomyces goshikiensis]|uniref:phage holin family protein n=1 Tax=Streptomyces goshikiensis TaxID=1942 RepID=UPI003674E7A0
MARAEMREKGKRYGTGGGLCAAAGVLGLFPGQAQPATRAVAAPALAISGTLATVAAVTALAGKQQITKAGAPIPEQTLDSVKAYLAEVKEKAHR